MQAYTPVSLDLRSPLPHELAPGPYPEGGWCWAWDDSDYPAWDMAWVNPRDSDHISLDYATHFLPWYALPNPRDRLRQSPCFAKNPPRPVDNGPKRLLAFSRP